MMIQIKIIKIKGVIIMNRITHPKNPKAEIRNNIIYWNMNK